MKPRPSLNFLILSGTLSIAAPALQAQILPILPGAQSNVTLTLTSSFTEDNADKYSGPNTIYSGRIVKAAYGNKQLIADMNEAGDLPDNTVTGWKLVMVNRNPEDDNGEDGRSFYLVKTARPPVPVPYLSLSERPGFAESYTGTVPTVGDDNEIITGKSTFRGQFGLEGYLPGEDYTQFSMVGLLTGSDKTGPVKISNQPFKFIYQLVSAKLGGIVGSAGTYDEDYGYEDYEDDEDYTDYEDEELIEGSVSFSAETPIDISGYPAPIE